MQALQAQSLVFAPAKTKIQLSMLSKALVDALGGPAEFKPRFRFPLITTMQHNKTFDLAAGTWTDDTSMALCLARSISKGFDELDQLDAYSRWWQEGYLSATGNCFDIGNTIRRAVGIYAEQAFEGKPANGLVQVKQELKGEMCAGNGSLMRVLPVGLAYWKEPSEEWMEYSIRSSETTHPNDLCKEACLVWVGVIVKMMRANEKRVSMTKADVLQHFATFPYQHPKLKDALASDSLDEHPILKLIHATSQSRATSKSNPLNLPDPRALPSSGYVLHTLVAALYCFLSTETFEEGAIAAVNLGNDADTVGAVYGGLAGCWYSSDEENDAFWSPRVKEWRDNLVRRDLVEQVAMELVEYQEKRN
ncbi:ADP-ribosylation/Crystallin J1 [Mycena floridula]|nr:ADP-ribosylation/Crystallin J1 [Mycena floridula]